MISHCEEKRVRKVGGSQTTITNITSMALLSSTSNSIGGTFKLASYPADIKTGNAAQLIWPDSNDANISGLTRTATKRKERA